MYWGLSGLSYAAAQYTQTGAVSDSMIVSALVQVSVRAHFFYFFIQHPENLSFQGEIK
jgi:hypothetical protein